MNVTCIDRERILMDGSAEEWSALEVHAAVCAECSEEVRTWKSMSVAANELRQEWETPYLWSKIEHKLAEQMKEKPSRMRAWLNSFGTTGFHWQTVAALAVLIAVSGTAIWMVVHRRVEPGSPVFLKNSAVNDVERAEEAYQKAIDKLDAQAQPQLKDQATPLMASYREKLLVLDNAIAELREEAGQNPANAHLRRQLLAMYQEKQETLQEVLGTKR
jgi:antitoxin component HigA of HigAB toxin-antitoxin module